MKLKQINGVYHAVIATPKGRKTISTRATNRTDAEKIARDSGIAQLEIAARAGRLTQEAIGRLTTGNKLTMEKAVDAFKTWLPSVVHAARTQYTYLQVLTKWMSDMNIAKLPPAAVNEDHINPFINDRSSDTAYTHRVFMLAAIRKFFTYCSAKGWCPGNPALLVSVNMDILSHKQKEKKPITLFTEADVKTLFKFFACRLKKLYLDLEATRKKIEKDGNLTVYRKKLKDLEWFITETQFWEVAARLSWELALRISDAATLEWASFELAGHIVIWTKKRDKRIALPISDELSEFITTIPVNNARYVFPDQCELWNDHKKRAYLSVRFSHFLAQAGLEAPGRTYHSLRHSRITLWKKQGVTLEQIAKDVGHSSTKTTKGYLHG
jgi:integrase